MVKSNEPSIRKVMLHNFKSVIDRQEVEFGSLTLLMGENSSGKSSILQVLRLLQQSLLSESGSVEATVETDSRFPLNGRHIRVGKIEQIRNARNDEDNVSFGVEIKGVGIKNDKWDFNLDIEINGTMENAPSFTYIKKLKMMCSQDKQSLWNLEVDLKESTIDDIEYREDSLSRYLGRDIFEDVEDVEDVTEGRFIVGQHKRKAVAFGGTYFLSKSSKYEVSGLVLDGASVPQQVTVQMEANQVYADTLLHSIMIKHVFVRDEDRTEDQPRISNKDGLVNYAFDRISELLDEYEFDKIPGSCFREKLPDLEKELFDNIKKERVKIIEEISEKISRIEKIGKKQMHIAKEITYPHPHYFARRFNKVKYLGPLREAPRLLMPTSTSLYDVGEKGEYTAAVLLYQGKLRRSFPVPSPSFSESDNYSVSDEYSGNRMVSLEEATEQWCSKLGLAEKIETTDEADWGLGMKARPPGTDILLPLTAVGVGVSQLLPVLVCCLLAQPGDVILLEQPELHLHPALQQRLADFLICMSHSGRQLIVETHSEYILSRLRRRIAEESEESADDDKVMNLVKVIFAKRCDQSGTEYTSLDFTTYGNLKEWPEGFFDQATEDERAIIEKAYEKWERKRNAPDLLEDG